jgi:hypothetical protein
MTEIETPRIITNNDNAFGKRSQVTSKLVIPFVRDDINSTQPASGIGPERSADGRFVFIE